MSVAAQIEQLLTDAFAPTYLEVRDVSAGHAGHAGARPGGETHFEDDITAPAFADMSRIQRHRAVNHVLADLLAGPIHALQIAATPS